MSSLSALETLSNGKPPVEPRHIVRSGAELVALTERFHLRIFTGVIGAVGLASLAALAMLPLRSSAADLSITTPTVALTCGLLIGTPLAMRQARILYAAMRANVALEAVPAALAAALLAYPLRSELWWPALALLVLVGTVGTTGRALAYCLGVLLVNLCAHAVAGDLGQIEAVTVVGLWVGLPFWTACGSIFTEHMGLHLMRTNERHVRRLDPRRVEVSVSAFDHTAATPTEPAAEAPTPPDALEHLRAEGQRGAQSSPLSDLTSRQLEVVALLADGMRYREIAACLSITPRQVQRHVAGAVARAGVENANHLVALAVAEGLVPPGRRERDETAA